MNNENMSPLQARHYIDNFRKHVIAGMTYVDFPSGRIELDNMTNDEAVKVAYGLMEMESEAATKRNRRDN